MGAPVRTINPHISVDCVIFGFTTNQLKVLLIEREYLDELGDPATDHKLPGDFIAINEDPDLAATRTLEELTGLKNIYLQSFAMFGHPDRISRQVDFQWLRATTGMNIHRVVTAAYYALINITEARNELVTAHHASWTDMKWIPALAFDHEEIIQAGLHHLQRTLRNEPIGFELLPERFTIRELQSLYEVILGHTLDNRNFRKKVLKARYLVQLDEKQEGVPHKPAHYYRFDRDLYEKINRDQNSFNF